MLETASVIVPPLLDDVVESGLAGVVLADGVRADEPGALARLQDDRGRAGTNKRNNPRARRHRDNASRRRLI